MAFSGNGDVRGVEAVEVQSVEGMEDGEEGGVMGDVGSGVLLEAGGEGGEVVGVDLKVGVV